MTTEALLSVENMNTRFTTPEGDVHAATDLSFQICKGETLGVVGESGSGKTQAFMAILGLLADNGKATGKVMFRGRNILGLPKKELNKIRGDRISMIFQDPMTSLNPYLTISRQMTEVLELHQGIRGAQAQKAAIEALDMVRIPEAKKRINLYPHEFSGGMRQRVMIAMSLLCKPDLLIADEPTTALDVTVQAQILDLMRDLQKEMNMSIVIITHDLGVVAGLSDRVMVMYGGKIAEIGDVNEIFYRPQHPYTKGLLNSTLRLDEAKHDLLQSIEGNPPSLQNLPSGCSFHPRCPYASDRCKKDIPLLREVEMGTKKACHFDKLTES